jgi:hypothetical protein
MTTTPVEKGRSVVVRVVAISIAISVLTIVTFNVTQGTGRLPQQLGRFSLTLILCLFLVRGHSWARLVSAALFIFAAITGLLGSVALLGKSLGAFALLAMAAAYLYCSWVLLASSAVRAFFATSKGAVAAPDSGA